MVKKLQFFSFKNLNSRLELALSQVPEISQIKELELTTNPNQWTCSTEFDKAVIERIMTLTDLKYLTIRQQHGFDPPINVPNLSRLTKLTHLSLSRFGPVNWITRLTQLHTLQLHACTFRNTILSSLKLNTLNLTKFNVRDVQLPDSLVKLCLWQNVRPYAVSHLTNLKTLWTNCDLVGISTLTNLESLVLGSSVFTPDFFVLSQLQELNLQTVKIPPGCMVSYSPTTLPVTIMVVDHHYPTSHFLRTR
eukprot:TRINITY_DN931_c0_g1_i7.p1 TRINITY_DN931_c0_g1~~TRINITY_DN931_c0_g1_i7.p1  ORF type:complete len:249 (+),score=32.06 TRINITY_DN931_c0_g1_i7:302-1048(+)